MPTEEEIYQQHADQYQRLVGREDYHGHILKSLEMICPLNGLDVVELGAGTGRLTRILAPHVGVIKAFDTSAHMLSRAESNLHALGLTNWHAGLADHRHIPVADASANLVISGWSFCYLAVWGGERWRAELEAGFQEIMRILRPGGYCILLETLGTGQETPKPPEHLAGYFAWLAEKGFKNTWFRSDYRFNSLAEAVALSKFFFGEKLGREMEKNKWLILPECTGLWWYLKLPSQTS
ncbi:MAG TPA: class I SAM-dependent methyltransferase [Anaerolineales bacterium]|jgi:ubiquinone/menaquinone biosynthesis C-methylase UbiE